MIAVVARRELLSLMRTPMVWTALAVSQLVLGWLFLLLIEDYLTVQGRLTSTTGVGITDLVVVPLLRSAGGLLLVLGPVIAMRSIAGERNARTIGLPLSSPVSLIELVLGKFTAAAMCLGLVWLLVAAMTGTLALGTTLDSGRVAAGLLGLALLVGSGIAVGVLASTLLPQPAAAALAGGGLLLGLWLIGSGAAQNAQGALQHLAPTPYFDRLLQGLVSSGDLAYFALLIVGCLGFSVHLLDVQRVQGR